MHARSCAECARAAVSTPCLCAPTAGGDLQRLLPRRLPAHHAQRHRHQRTGEAKPAKRCGPHKALLAFDSSASSFESRVLSQTLLCLLLLVLLLLLVPLPLLLLLPLVLL